MAKNRPPAYKTLTAQDLGLPKGAKIISASTTWDGDEVTVWYDGVDEHSDTPSGQIPGQLTLF